MGERSAYTPGTFCWADVAGTEPETQQRFYEELFGWTTEATPGYWMFTLGGRNVAGMFPAPPTMDAPVWINYVSVEDAEATVARARELGAEVHVEPRDVGPAGRMALLADPQGAVFALWQPGLHVGAQLVNDVGAMAWNGLSTTDVDAAASFYGELFGWTREPWEDSQGDYWLFRNSEGWLNGGVEPLPADDVPPHWTVTFSVLDVQDAGRRAAELGGGEIVPPTTTAIGDTAVAHDPAGASFVFFAGQTDP